MPDDFSLSEVFVFAGRLTKLKVTFDATCMCSNNHSPQFCSEEWFLTESEQVTILSGFG